MAKHDHDDVREITRFVNKSPTVQHGESPRDKFVRLANARMNTVLHSIWLIGKLGNRHVYEFDKRDVDNIRNTLLTAVDRALDKFEPQEKQRKVFDISAVEEE